MTDNIRLVQPVVLNYGKIYEVAEQVQDTIKKLDLDNLVATDENLAEIKKVRASLNADFDSLEKDRKAIKNKILEPYEAFNNVYEENIKRLFTEAKTTLTTKINEVEERIKADKEKEIIKFFEANNSNSWLNYDTFKQRKGFAVGLSKTETALKKEVRQYLDEIEHELETINSLPNKEELMVEYSKTLNFRTSISIVQERLKQEEMLKASKANEEQQAQVTEPKKQEQLFKLKFEVVGTKDELLGLKNYLQSKGLKYDTIN